jgi:S1-C subfamily serine protease
MALLPPFMLDCVVAIGTTNQQAQTSWIGTGFLYGLYESGEGDQKLYKVWLVTNKHVIANLSEIQVKFNSLEDEKTKDYSISLLDENGNPEWFGHPDPDVDVAAIFVDLGILRSEKRHYRFFQSDIHLGKREELKEIGITEGDRAFVLGFPMGLVSDLKQYTFCRSGAFARVRDYIEGKSNQFILDALVFPGNSGGPVITCPSALCIKGTNTIPKADLVGIVKSYIPYRDVAISRQTGREKVVFEENSGLTLVDSADSIHEVVELAQREFAEKVNQLKLKAEQGEGDNA